MRFTPEYVLSMPEVDSTMGLYYSEETSRKMTKKKRSHSERCCTNFYSGLKKSTDNADFANKIGWYIFHTAAELLLCE